MGAVLGTHLNWRREQHAVMSGQAPLKPVDVVSHDACDFGRWLHSPESATLSAGRVFGEVLEAHGTVHRVASDIIISTNSGRRERIVEWMRTFGDVRQCFF